MLDMKNIYIPGFLIRQINGSFSIMAIMTNASFRNKLFTFEIIIL